MSYSYGKKSKPLERVKTAFRKVALYSAVAAGAAAPVAYEWGTVRHDTITVTDYEFNKDGETGRNVIYTDRGTFNMEPARLRFQSSEDTTRMMRDVYRGNTYDITTYGWHIGMGWQPNIYSIRRLSAEELEKRKKEQQDPRQGGQQQVAATGAVATAAPKLSGQMVSTTVTINGYAIDIALPVEAAGKVVISDVRPVVTTTPAPVTTPIVQTPAPAPAPVPVQPAPTPTPTPPRPGFPPPHF